MTTTFLSVADLGSFVADGEIIYFDHGIPSNFYRQAPFQLYLTPDHVIRILSSEHGFHFLKAMVFNYNAIPILQAITPLEARHLGRALPLTGEQQIMWDTQLALPAMLQVNMAKFWQNPPCRQWLIQTGNARLVEHRPDARWGDNMDGTGRNLLGRVLELVRATVQ